MKKKILGFFVCTLLIAVTVLPVVGTTNVSNGVIIASPLASSFFPYQDGWPFISNISTSTNTQSINVADINNDSYIELILPFYNKIYAWKYDGTLLNGWPIQPSHNHRGTALGDLDNDGKLEIVCAFCESGVISIFSYNGQEVTAGWPKSVGGSIIHSPVLEDIDNDGELEIISMGNNYEVYAWNFDGSNVPNWPVDLSPYVSGSPCAIVVGDVNRDGFKEVVVTSMSRIFVLSNEGEVLYNWQPDADPYSVSSNYPVLADINNDDSLEILLTSYNEVFAWRYNGQEIWKKVYAGEAGQIAIGNIECNSSSPEIIVCSRHKVYGYHGDGTSLSGNWPVSIENVSWVWSSGVHSGSAIGDIDGDNELEVILNGYRKSDSNWVIYALNPDGSVVEGYPIVEGGYNNVIFSNTPVLADIDKDGDIELCSYAQTYPQGPEVMIVVVYDLPFPYNPQKIDWPMLRHDCRRTGVYLANQPPGTPIINGPHSGKPGRTYSYTFVSKDSDGDDVYYEIDWGEGSVEPWDGPYDSNIVISIEHSWDEMGEFTIMARAKDDYEAIGEWGTFDVTMPKNKPFVFNFPLLNWLLERFPNAFPILRYIVGLS